MGINTCILKSEEKARSQTMMFMSFNSTKSSYQKRQKQFQVVCAYVSDSGTYIQQKVSRKCINFEYASVL